ncbi:MAG: 50S ribosomal protein L18 [Gammaproteobacteria bacterium]|nr:50S ribosomal protein L18 [Gammaproteobacteria bacterium]
MSDKKTARLRRARKVRARIARLGALRLSVHRTPRHFYAQLFDASGCKVLVAASTLDPQVRKQLKSGDGDGDGGGSGHGGKGGGGNVAAAGALGKLLAERAKAAGIERVAFDRSGFRYHGRVKAFAEAARAGGLNF